MLTRRLFAGLLIGALFGAVANSTSAIYAVRPRVPSPADFVGYPSCMLYAQRADVRVRVRAARAGRECALLARSLGAGWSPRPRRAAQILSPICRFADTDNQIELEVIDDASGAWRGASICTSLARAGWLDLSSP